MHVVLRVAQTAALADVVQRLKGATAYDVNLQRLLDHPLRWQAGYWAESLGPADLQYLIRYVHHQRLHHDDSHPAERWQMNGEPAEGGL